MTISKGEVRKVGVEVINQQGDDFVIETADYEITKSSGEQVTSGYAAIEDHKVLTLFSAAEVGTFYCTFTYRVASEILKAKVFIQVQ